MLRSLIRKCITTLHLDNWHTRFNKMLFVVRTFNNKVRYQGAKSEVARNKCNFKHNAFTHFVMSFSLTGGKTTQYFKLITSIFCAQVHMSWWCKQTCDCVCTLPLYCTNVFEQNDLSLHLQQNWILAHLLPALCLFSKKPSLL